MVKETEERIYGMPMAFARSIGTVGVSAAVTTANARVAEESAQSDPSAIFPGGGFQ